MGQEKELFMLIKQQMDIKQRIQVSRTGVRSIIKKFKGSHTVQTKTRTRRKQKISNTLERKTARDFEVRLKYAKYAVCFPQMSLNQSRDAAYVWRKKGEKYNPKNGLPTVKQGNWGYNAVGMLQCIWNWESHENGRNHKEIMICEDS